MPHSCALLGGFVIGARVALLWQLTTLWKFVAEPSGNRQAHRTPHAARTTHECGVRLTLPSHEIKSTRLLRALFHFVHTAGVL